MLLNETETFQGFEETNLTLQGKSVAAWKLDNDFSVIRAFNQDRKEVFYRYDKVDGLFQRYTEPVEPPVVEEPVVEEEKNPFLDEYALYIIIGLAALSVILLVALICVLCSKKHKRQVGNIRIQKRLDKQIENSITDEFEK